jgi:hypothetical protein
MGEASRPGAKRGTERAERDKRLAKALRDNLQRRKEQARARQRLAAPLSKEGAGGDGEPPA